MISNSVRRILDFLGIAPIKVPEAEVVDIEMLSPSIKRIQIKGQFEKLHLNSGAYISFTLNYVQTRKYTIATLDKEKGCLELLVYLHHHKGNGQRFMDQLKIGDQMNMNSLRSNSNHLNLATSKYVFFGDETSLGLGLSLLNKWKQQQVDFLFLFELDKENQDLPEKLGFEQTWVYPKKNTFRNERMIGQLEPIKSNQWKDAVFLLTGNAKSIQIFRKVIKDKTTSKVYTRGYWIEGIEGL
ncbi:FAD-binding oxidoreductase [Myroides sp. DW712]|uniref:FAD-binding oxidoreductase n=1 Tax=Myroides sp. DW712 TaxID=3389800 RepID=UPI00397CD0D7